MIERHELESLGRQLRSLGHRRHELAERVFAELQQGSHDRSNALYRELTDVTGQAITLMQRQLDTFGAEVEAGQRRTYTVERTAASAHVGQLEQAQELIPQLNDVTGQGTDPVPRPRESS